jgi:hypothetical protein
MKKPLILLSVPFQAIIWGGLAGLLLGWVVGLFVFSFWIALGIKILLNYDKV